MWLISLDYTIEPGVPESRVLDEQCSITGFVEEQGIPYSEADEDVKSTFEVPLGNGNHG